jgi:hypothetical protein
MMIMRIYVYMLLPNANVRRTPEYALEMLSQQNTSYLKINYFPLMRTLILSLFILYIFQFELKTLAGFLRLQSCVQLQKMSLFKNRTTLVVQIRHLTDLVLLSI